ncbi:expansin-like B1 [Humulus lupulus]|uniref:expansin-like B1 n=1 Tax=Humulus lupulus TaxID=3486 RepID=UPI002B410D22|nr:expansin-like B1 [Humulus lupulus]
MRISCKFPGYSVTYKINENNNYPHYLALSVLYVSGHNETTAVELWQEDTKQWKPKRRAYGAVWDMKNPPSGSITLRFQATTSSGYAYSLSEIPSDKLHRDPIESRSNLPPDPLSAATTSVKLLLVPKLKLQEKNQTKNTKIKMI